MTSKTLFQKMRDYISGETHPDECRSDSQVAFEEAVATKIQERDKLTERARETAIDAAMINSQKCFDDAQKQLANISPPENKIIPSAVFKAKGKTLIASVKEIVYAINTVDLNTNIFIRDTVSNNLAEFDYCVTREIFNTKSGNIETREFRPTEDTLKKFPQLEGHRIIITGVVSTTETVTTGYGATRIVDGKIVWG